MSRRRKKRMAQNKDLLHQDPPKGYRSPQPEPEPYTEEDLEEEGFRRVQGRRIMDDLLFNLLQRDELFNALAQSTRNEAESLKRYERVMEEETLKDLRDEMRGWNQSSGIGLADFSAANRQALQEQCFHLFYRDPVAHNIIRAYTSLTVGDGMEVVFREEDQKAAERWDIIAKNNQWEQRYRHVITMTYLLGEWFVVRYPKTGTASAPKFTDLTTGEIDRKALAKALAKVPPEKVKIRSLEPNEIESTIPAKQDREVIVGFETTTGFHGDKPSEATPKYFWAEDITHFKNDALGVWARGRSVLEPVIRALAYRRMFLLDRVTMNAVRTRIPMLYQVPGGASAKYAAKTKMNARGLPRPGTVWIDGVEAKITYPNLNLSGQDAHNDYRAILLAIAAGVSLPEFLISMDAAASNYASALVTASPLVPIVGGMRAAFGHLFADLIEECVGARPAIRWPVLVVDNMLDAVRANSILFHDRIISRSTYAARSGVHWEGPEGEKQKLDEEDPDMLPPLDNRGDKPASPGSDPADRIPGQDGLKDTKPSDGSEKSLPKAAKGPQRQHSDK